MNPRRVKAYTYLLITAVVWGLAGPISKFTLAALTPLLFLTYRFGLSSLVSAPSLIRKNKFKKIINKGITLQVLIYAFLTSTVALGLLYIGLDNTTVLDMSFITLIGPLMIAAAGVVFLNEHITKREKIGMSIAFFGSIITIIQPLFENGANLGQLTGNVLIFLYLVVNTASIIMSKKLLRQHVEPETLTNISFIVGFITLLPLAIIFTNQNPFTIISGLSIPFHLGVIYMAFLSGNLAYTLWYKGQKTIEVGEAALFNYLYPIFAAPLAIWWLGEQFTPIFIIGAIFIITGVIIAEYKKPKKMVQKH